MQLSLGEVLDVASSNTANGARLDIAMVSEMVVSREPTSMLGC